MMSTGVEIVISATMLSFIVTLIMMVSLLGRNVSEQQANADQMNEYRKYAAYNNSTLTLSDYQTAITELVGKTRISIIDSRNGRNVMYGYNDVTIPEDWYLFGETNASVEVKANLFAPTVDGGVIKEWESGSVGGVNFTIKARASRPNNDNRHDNHDDGGLR